MKKTVAIIGAGPAGIEAASILAEHSFQVVVYEKAAQPLSNIVDKANLFPNFADAQSVAQALSQKLRHPRITLLANKEVGEILPPSEHHPQWTVEGEPYDAVLLATGYTPFDAHRKEELGYGIYPGVHTSLEMEEMLRHKCLTLSAEQPKRVVFLQCVGSRDEKTGNHYCSKLCCITAVKQAIEVKKLSPSTEVYIFYMDLRLWGQHFEELYRSAQQQYGVKFVRGRISEASQTFDGRVQIKAEDTLMGLPMKLTSDMLILMVGMEASEGTKRLAKQCQICGEYGFAQSYDPHLYDNLTLHQGLFLAGSCKRPMTLTDAVNDGRSAVWQILSNN